MAKDVRRRPHCVQPREGRSELENSGEVDSLTLKMISGHGGARSNTRVDSAPDAALGFRRETGCALRFEVPGHRAGARGPQQGFLQTSGMKCYRDPNGGSGSCVFVKDGFNGEESRCVSPAEALAW